MSSGGFYPQTRRVANEATRELKPEVNVGGVEGVKRTKVFTKQQLPNRLAPDSTQGQLSLTR